MKLYSVAMDGGWTLYSQFGLSQRWAWSKTDFIELSLRDKLALCRLAQELIWTSDDEFAKVYQGYIRSKRWMFIKNAKIEEVGHCEVIGTDACGDYLQVHHLSYECLGFESPEDLRVLCAKHHAQTHKEKPVSHPSTRSFHDAVRAAGISQLEIDMFQSYGMLKQRTRHNGGDRLQ